MTLFTQAASALTVSQNDRLAAAAYLKKHAGATALVIVLPVPEPDEREVLASHL
jgi:hypothetical protein